MSQTDLHLSRAADERVHDTAKIMDKGWEAVQKKTFTNWINNQLKKGGVPPIANLDTDLSTGENLLYLLEIIGDEKFGKINRNPKHRLQKVENLNKALEFIKSRGVNLTNIGAEDIADSNAKLILGLIWTIILRFSIAEISEEGRTAKEGLLLWCQRRTAPYSTDFHIEDFTRSWQDGLALCALIHRHRPDLLNYWALDKKQKHANTQLAMDIAEQHLDIPKLFAVEDIVDVIKPDERSVMTYVAQYFHAFSALDKFGVAGRRVGQFGQVLQQAWELQNDYEQRVRALLAATAEVQQQWAQSNFSGYLDARNQLHEFENYKVTTKRGWVAERRALDSLLGNIQTKLKTYNLRPYTPPAGLTLEDLAESWSNHVNAEGARKRAIVNHIREAKDALKKQFANAAHNLQDQLNQVSRSLASLSGDLEAQLQQAQSLTEQLNPLQQGVEDLKELNQSLVAANIEDNEFTIYSAEDFDFELSLLRETVTKKVAFIQNQIVARSKTNFTPQQLEEYSETFRHFDKDNNNALNRNEFKAALQAEGTSYKDEEFEKVFLEVSHGAEEINFEQFIEYARAQEEDTTTPEQLSISFQTLAADKPYVTEADLYRGGISNAVVEYLKTVLPAHPQGGYDYSAFLSGSFA